MQMGAIVNNYGYDEAIIKAINAGCDMLIISNNGTTYDEKDPHEAVDIIYKAVKDGQISEQQINDSYNRIQSLKEKYGIKKKSIILLYILKNYLYIFSALGQA
jgi:beta-N-acetylhexosaminidase